MTTENMSATFGSAELTQKAETMLDTLETAAPTQEAPRETTPTVTEAPPQQSTFNEDTLVTVKIDGQEQQVPFKELKNGYSRESTFTQRMQALAKQREELTNFFAEQQAQVAQQQRAIQMAREELQRTNPLQQLLQMQQQQQVAPKNPNEIATLGELQAAQQAMVQQLQQLRQQDQQALQAALARTRAEAEESFEIKRDQARFTDAMTKLLSTDEGKLLTELNPRAESIIRFETMQMQPETVDDAIQYMTEYVKEWQGKVKGRLTTTSAVQSARTVMEPPAGSPPAIAQSPKIQILGKDGSVNYEGLRAKALSLLN